MELYNLGIQIAGIDMKEYPANISAVTSGIYEIDNIQRKVGWNLRIFSEKGDVSDFYILDNENMTKLVDSLKVDRIEDLVKKKIIASYIDDKLTKITVKNE